MMSLLVAAAASVVVVSPDSTRAVATRYLELTFSQQYDSLRTLYHEDVLFVDPTGDVWGGQLAEGLRGAEPVIALQKSWGLTSADFQIATAFVVDEYALFRGELSWTTASDPAGRTTDFMTILRVVDGRVAERHDYGNYTAILGTVSDQVERNTRRTEEVAPVYLQAYLDQQHDTMAAMYGPHPSFQDPTAAYFGNDSGTRFDGRDAIVTMMERVFQPITAFRFDQDDTWFSNHHAVFVGTIRFTLTAASLGTDRDVTFEHDAVFVISVEDGRVVDHRDFVDYSTFRRQRDAAGG